MTHRVTSALKKIYVPIIRFGKGFSGSCLLLRFFSLRWFEQEPKKSRTFDVFFPQCTSETGVNYQVDYYQSPICDTWKSSSSSEEISPSPSDSEGGGNGMFLCLYVTGRKGPKGKKKKKKSLSLRLHEEPQEPREGGCWQKYKKWKWNYEETLFPFCSLVTERFILLLEYSDI